MAKQSSIFVCSSCGATSPKWIGRCPSCNNFNTYAEEIVKPSASSKNRTSKALPIPLKNVKGDSFVRVKSGSFELDRVLGGGIVPGSLILIGGDPGIGKSTLLTQIAGKLGASGQKVLYFSAEESCAQVKLRADRLKVDSDNLFIVNETCLNNLEDEFEGYDTIIIDSIQAVYIDELSSSAGSVGQVRESAAKLMRIAKSKGITFFMVGHVTKEGSIAGPKVLEHIMDVVLYIEGETENNFKLLRSVKNRFGSAMEVGVFEMTQSGLLGVKDYSGIFISGAQPKNAGSIILPYMSGNRCIPVEIQTLITKTIYGMPRRMPSGVDYNKLVLLIAVLEKRCNITFYNDDVYINAAGGIKVGEPSCDPALICALAGANKNLPTKMFSAAFGEVSLTGEVRGVNFAEKRVQECINAGIEKIALPYKNLKQVEKYKDKAQIKGVSYCHQAIDFFYK